MHEKHDKNISRNGKRVERADGIQHYFLQHAGKVQLASLSQSANRSSEIHGQCAVKCVEQAASRLSNCMPRWPRAEGPAQSDAVQRIICVPMLAIRRIVSAVLAPKVSQAGVMPLATTVGDVGATFQIGEAQRWSVQCARRPGERGLPKREAETVLGLGKVGSVKAFLIMDIEQRAGRTAANMVFNRYIARCGDITLLPLLPIYLSQRAMIHAYVDALEKKAEYKNYLDAAIEYLRPSTSPVVAIGGLQGTGKTTLAYALAPLLGPAPGALVLRSDELRKRLNHVPPETRLSLSAYTPEANVRLKAVLLEAAAAAATSMHGLIIDTSFLSSALRAQAAQIAENAGRAWLGLWLEAPLPILEDRLARRSGDASDAGPEVMREAALIDPGPITWHRLDASNPTLLRNEALRLIHQVI